MQVKNYLGLGFLIVLWWVGLWGLIETIVQQFIRGSVKKAIMIYSSMIAFVALVIYLNPNILEHFI